MNISIIIPNYNGRELLVKNIPKVIHALEGYTKGFVEIIIADDGSKDNSVVSVREILEAGIPQHKHLSFRIIQHEKNKGFSGNVNSGVKGAKGDVIVLLNTDVVPQKEFLAPLVSHFADPQVFAVGCMDESIEEGKTVLRGRGIGQWQRGFLHHSAGSLDSTSTLWVSGGSGAFRKSLWEKLGGLNELYNPFYWEDIDLSYRAQKAGYTVLFEKESVVRHEHSKGTIKSLYTQMQIKRIAYRNQFLFTWLNLTDTMLLVLHFFWLPYHFARAIKHKDVAFFYGFFSALLKVPQVRRYRINSKKMLKKGDEEVVAMNGL